MKLSTNRIQIRLLDRARLLLFAFCIWVCRQFYYQIDPTRVNYSHLTQCEYDDLRRRTLETGSFVYQSFKDWDDYMSAVAQCEAYDRMTARKWLTCDDEFGFVTQYLQCKDTVSFWEFLTLQISMTKNEAKRIALNELS